MTDTTTTNTRAMPSMKRAATLEPSSYNAEARTVDVVFTTGATGRRYDFDNGRYYDEELVVADGSVILDRLNAGASVLDTHADYQLSNVIGAVVPGSARIEAGQGLATIRMSDRPELAGICADVQAGVIRHISVGYALRKVEMIAPADRTDGGANWLYRVVRWEPMEISFVPVPFDAGSSTRSHDPQGAEPCEFTTRAAAHHQQEETPMPEATAGGASTSATTQPAASATSAAPAVDASALLSRAAEITELCTQHGTPTMAAELIRAGADISTAKAKILDAKAAQDIASGGHHNARGVVQTVRDEMQVRLAGIEQAIMHRIASGTEIDDNGRRFRGMTLLEMGRNFLEAHNVRTEGMSRLELASNMLQFRSGGYMGTSDFSSLFASVANKRLRQAYEQSPGSFTLWARRAPNAPDFKSMSVVQLSGAPDLLQTNESGEFKYGKMTDGAETYSLMTYGRIVSLTRQAIVNDDLRGFERLVTAFGQAANRLQNRTVYSILTANAALSDGVALFHASHSNLTASGAALGFTTLAAARTAMRLQKGYQSEELNIAPKYLIVPAALEQTAYQLTSSQYTPSTKGEINEFRSGGRTEVTPIVEPVLDANSSTAWYLASDTSMVDTVEYCYLDGAEGPVIESQVGFDSDGVNYKCRLDFAAKAIDFRGLQKASA